ncbi:MAG: hypothetical protein HZA37_00315 [Parcubacteria group bacterium]|nr:hypothetical protein [Parcubacteria group bacterium]
MINDEKAAKLAKILRVDQRVLGEINDLMESATGKTGVLDIVYDENETFAQKALNDLGLSRKVPAVEVYDSLISKIEADDLAVFNALDRPNLNEEADCQRIIDLAAKIAPVGKGFFLKEDIARSFVLNEPPKMMMSCRGFTTAEDLVKNEDLLEIFAALRMVEDPGWLNNVFFKQYEKLTPDDFEEREINARALSKSCVEAARKFVKKKYHNISHLKELGAIFVIPVTLGISGETVRSLSLLAHYFNEIKFYSDLFRHFAGNRKTFAKNLISLLRGDVIEERLPIFPKELRRPRWLIVQRYLAKADPNDWRLFEPHVDPEATHWQKAERGLADIPEVMPHFKNGIDFWKELGFVGDFFQTESGIPVLVSFNIVDAAMSLLKEKELSKYLYHHQEAMWNRIFVEFMGEEKMNELIRDNIIKGYFEL